MIMVSTKTCMQHDSKWVQKINPNQQRTTLKVKHNQCIHIPMKLPRGHSESGLIQILPRKYSSSVRQQ